MNSIIVHLPSDIGEKINKEIPEALLNPAGGWKEWEFDINLPWSTFLATRNSTTAANPISNDNYTEIGFASFPYIQNCPWMIFAVVEHPLIWIKKARRINAFKTAGTGITAGIPKTFSDYLKIWVSFTKKLINHSDYVYRWEDIQSDVSCIKKCSVPISGIEAIPKEAFDWEIVKDLAESLGYFKDHFSPCPIHKMHENMEEIITDPLEVSLPPSKVKLPKVQIVMPAYNSSKWIRQAIQSIVDQTFKKWELIIVDDGSVDATFLIASDMAAKDDRIRVMKKINGGTGSALNAGWQHVKAQYQTWWSSDSWAEPIWLSTLVSALDSDPSVGFVYGDHTIYQQDCRRHIDNIFPEFDMAIHQYKCLIGSCWLWRKSVKDLAGDWSLNVCEDYEMWLRMAEITKFKKVSGILGHWRQHDSNLSLDCNKDNWKESRRIVSRHKWNKAKIKVASVCPWLDPAGVNFGLYYGLNESPHSIAARGVLKLQSNLGQQNDLMMDDPKDKEEIEKVLDECDIIHCNCTLDFDFTPWLDKGKKFIYHLHAGPWTTQLDKINNLKEKYNAKIVSCEPGIKYMIQDAIWVPNPIALDPKKLAWDYHLFEPLSENYLDDTEFKMHMHHNYEIGKHTIQIKQAINDLKQFNGVDISCHFLNDYDTCMKIRDHIQFKKNFNVCVDTIIQGFIGMAGFISMAQGTAVIARLDEHSIREYTALGEGEMPPIVNVRGINEFLLAVMDLHKHPEKLREIRKASREWMLKYYNIDRIISLWAKIYEEMMG